MKVFLVTSTSSSGHMYLQKMFKNEKEAKKYVKDNYLESGYSEMSLNLEMFDLETGEKIGAITGYDIYWKDL